MCRIIFGRKSKLLANRYHGIKFIELILGATTCGVEENMYEKSVTKRYKCLFFSFVWMARDIIQSLLTDDTAIQLEKRMLVYREDNCVKVFFSISDEKLNSRIEELKEKGKTIKNVEEFTSSCAQGN